MLTPKLTTALKSFSDLALGLFWDLHVLKTAVCLYVCRGVDVLSQVHSETCIMKIARWLVMTG